jgi:hypothetical protein
MNMFYTCMHTTCIYQQVWPGPGRKTSNPNDHKIYNFGWDLSVLHHYAIAHVVFPTHA